MHDHTPLFNPHALKSEKALNAGRAALMIVSILIFAKAIAFMFSGSASVLSTLTDSLADAMMSLTAFVSLRMSLKPADKEHRYGHGKIEGLFALLQSVIIAIAGAIVVFMSLQHLFNPVPLGDYFLSVAIMVLSILLSLLLVSIQKKALEDTYSLAIEADHAHYKTDIVINAGVLIVLLLIYYGFPIWIDAIFALVVAVYVWHTAYEVGQKAVNMLLDREIEEPLRQNIKDIVLSHSEILDMHDLRAIRSGMKMIVNFDIDVDPNILLWSAHEIARDVELDLLKTFPNAEIMIHIDPAGSPADSRHVHDVAEH